VHDSPRAGIHFDCLANPTGLMADMTTGIVSGGTNTADDETIDCFVAGTIPSSIEQNWGCGCPGACAMIECGNF
jgi:hypothetical protein